MSELTKKKSDARLTNSFHVGRYGVVAKGLQGKSFSEPLMKKVNAFLNDYDAEIDAWNVVRASEQTQVLDDNLNICLKYYRFILGSVDKYSVSPDAAQRQSAGRMGKLCDGVHVSTRLRQGELIGRLNGFLRKVNTGYTADVKALKLDEDISSLQEVLDAASDAYIVRSNEKKGVLSMTEARSNTEESFWRLAKALNGSAELEDDANGVCTTTVNTIANALDNWDKTHDLVKPKSKDGEEKEDNNKNGKQPGKDKTHSGSEGEKKQKETAADKDKTNGGKDKEEKTELLPENENGDEKQNEPEHASGGADEQPDSGGEKHEQGGEKQPASGENTDNPAHGSDGDGNMRPAL